MRGGEEQIKYGNTYPEILETATDQLPENVKDLVNQWVRGDVTVQEGRLCNWKRGCRAVDVEIYD